MAANIVPFPRRGANDNLIDPNPPQPGLRSFIVYSEAPEGCIAFEQPDDGVEPHLRSGEFALVDTSDRDPLHGELFLIEWMGGRREVVELRKRSYRFYDSCAGKSEEGEGWLALMRTEITSVASGKVTSARWADGPYLEHHMREKLVGRVVGILEPDFLPALRRAV